MLLLTKRKDGGSQSPVDAYFLIECKNLFSIALLKFNKGQREAFHNHAFHALTWFLSGSLIEEKIDGTLYTYKKSIFPKLTKKSNMHRVLAKQTSWCFTVRGPWDKYWKEQTKEKLTTLTHGRKVVRETLL